MKTSTILYSFIALLLIGLGVWYIFFNKSGKKKPVAGKAPVLPTMPINPPAPSPLVAVEPNKI